MSRHNKKLYDTAYYIIAMVDVGLLVVVRFVHMLVLMTPICSISGGMNFAAAASVVEHGAAHVSICVVVSADSN